MALGVSLGSSPGSIPVQRAAEPAAAAAEPLVDPVSDPVSDPVPEGVSEGVSDGPVSAPLVGEETPGVLDSVRSPMSGEEASPVPDAHHEAAAVVQPHSASTRAVGAVGNPDHRPTGDGRVETASGPRNGTDVGLDAID